MENIAGIFTSREDAQRAADQLRAIGIGDNHISLLSPGSPDQALESVPTDSMEQPGIGKAVGGVIGGALGVAGGMNLGAAAASLLIPGVGPVMAAGLIGAAFLGAGGALGGIAAGGALEDTLSEGLPKDELFVYEDALRQGRSIVIAIAHDDTQAGQAREIFVEAGAESLDSARDNWWLGLRDVEEEQYKGQGLDFKQDELDYRRGFEAALRPETRGKSFEEVEGFLQQRHPNAVGLPSFRRGYERGQDYYQGLTKAHKS